MNTPRDDMNHACRKAGDFAFQQVEKHGDVIPFAVVSGGDGDFRFVALGEDQVEDGGEKDVAKVREILRAGAKKGEYNVTAVVSVVRVRMDDTGEVTDAIRVEVEHVKDTPITCILPYRKKKNAVEQHIDPYMQAGARVIFP